MGVALSLHGLASLAAQEQTDPATAIEKWLSSEHDSDALLAAVVKAVCDAEAGMEALGGMQALVTKEPTDPRSKGLRSLMVQVALEHLRRTYKSDMTFVGQYAGLRPLQPWVGPFLFGLLLDTPSWYPLTFRVRLVPALRDLQAQLPGPENVAAMIDLVQDERESTDLRYALAALLWQWGKREHAKAFVQQLQLATTEGDGEDRVNATLALADYFTALREYKRSASAHLAAQALAHGGGVELLPVSWYAAACVHSLTGDAERGIAALRRCAEMHASPHLDSSRRLERKLFEQDPEIALLRKDPRFSELLKTAFGDARETSSEGGR